MNRIRRNIIANVIGRGWATFLGVAILPLYARALGAEAYGLVALYTSIAAICSLFDMGISASLGREIARATSAEEPGREIGRLVRTAEAVYVCIGVMLGGTVAICAPLIVSRWLHVHQLDPAVAIASVRLMGLYLSLQWSVGLYAAALSGLQRQVELNVITSVATTIRAGGAVVVLWAVASDLTVFYWWQAFSTAFYLLVVREALWRSPEANRATAVFDWSAVLRVRGFAAGVTVLSLASVLVSQLDKVVLAGMVPLSSFGYYALATSIASAATFFGQPVQGAVYPAMVEAHAQGDVERLATLFHRSTQLVSVVTFAPAAVLCVFARTVLQAWARDGSIAGNTADLVSVCVIGAAINAAAVMPYNLGMAVARVRPAILAAFSGLLIYGIALALLAPRIGVMAGAVGGVLVQLCTLFLYARGTVEPLLPGRAWPWLIMDLLLPFATALGTAMAVGAMTGPNDTLGTRLVWLVAASLMTLAGTIMVTPTVRREVQTRLQKFSFGSVRVL